MTALAADAARAIPVAKSATYFGLLLIVLIAVGFARELLYWRGRPVHWAQRLVSVVITAILVAFAYGFVVRDAILLVRLLIYVMPVMIVLWTVLWYWRYLDVLKMQDEIDVDRIKLLVEARKLGYKGPDPEEKKPDEGKPGENDKPEAGK